MSVVIKREAKIGLLMVVTVLLLIWGYNYLKGKSFFIPGNFYYVVYEDTGGVMESDPVMSRGYRIGYIDNIRISGELNYLVVRLSIDKRFSLPVGSVAQIYSYDMLGTKAIRIIPGSASIAHNPGDTIAGNIKPDIFDEISGHIDPIRTGAESMMMSIDSVMLSLHHLLDDSFRKSLSRSIHNLSNTLYTLDTLFSKEDSRMNRILSNIDSFSENIANSNSDITGAVSNLNSFSDSLVNSELFSVISRLDSVLADVNQLVESVNHGDGSLGKLVSDEELYNNLESAAKNLDLLLLDIRERPGRFVNFSIFGRSKE